MNTLKKSFFTLSACFSLASYVAAQSISEVDSALQTQTTSLLSLISTILTILLIAAFVFMVANIIFNMTNQKMSYTIFLVVLVLKGAFLVIFK
ncbi:hypothetical protein [Plebeiibacterium sediminum]|uniref:TrbC/VIRB2 family protein n=1 Tax=Plebeiibacterium sediminum TaxID=2992112 RepID=A0AAE3SGR1_9BACT|nr:hypothetical protein [Plebeiobacterium sediminum]MCW3788372.1 hypothetical protein [Plebeiobacterium sediminum]